MYINSFLKPGRAKEKIEISCFVFRLCSTSLKFPPSQKCGAIFKGGVGLYTRAADKDFNIDQHPEYPHVSIRFSWARLHEFPGFFRAVNLLLSSRHNSRFL
ncbi:hypothetical protein BFP49_17865 [Bacillus licheniformis]|nr:hypothetical protein BFP49_17865 [Bacillus licheniformis]